MGYKLKRATIRREKPEWHPGVNTLAYFPLKTDQLDTTGNYTLSATGTQQTVGYQFNTACGFSYNTLVLERYFSYWVNVSSNTRAALGLCNNGTFRLNRRNNATSYEIFVFKNANNSFIESSHLNLSYGTWYHVAYSASSTGDYACYINGTSVFSGNSTFALTTVSNIINNTTGNIIVSDIIIESEPRTDQEVQDYYNSTKGNYGYTPGETMEELQLRPRKWKPGTNTIVYFPLKSDAVDVVNNITLTSNGTTNYTTVGGVQSAEFTKSNWLYNDNVATVPQGDVAKTWNFWMYIKGSNTNRSGLTQVGGGTTAGDVFGTGVYRGTSNIVMTRNYSTSSTYTPTLNTWTNVAVTYYNSSWKMYVNGTLQVTWSETAPTNGNKLYLGQNVGSTNTGDCYYGNLSSVILENKERTAQEVLNYYNQTKGDYGIS